MNKRGDTAAVIFVFVTLILFGAVLYAFNSSNKAIQTTISGQEELENAYFDADNFNFYIEEAGEKAFVDTYNYFIDDDKYIQNRIRHDNYPILNEVKTSINEEFKEEFSKRFIEEMKKYGFENEKIKFSLNEENIIVRIEKSFKSENKKLSVLYNPEIIKEFSYSKFELSSFNDILSAKKSCEDSSEKKKCYEEKLANFNVNIENKGNFEVIILTSKREFLVVKESVDQNNEILTVSNIGRIQIIFRE